jgi:hypothetical protein
MTTDAQRIEAWVDTLPEHERERAAYLIGLPPSMAAARIDRDLRVEMRTEFENMNAVVQQAKNDILRDLRKQATAPQVRTPSKGTYMAISVVTAAVVQGIASAIHNLK